MTTKPASQATSAGRTSRLTPLPDPPLPPDMQPQFPHLSRAYLILEDHFAARADVFVGSEGYLCYDPHEIPRAPKPDCMVAIGLSIPPEEITESNGYAISEIGQAPDFVLEVASKTTGRRDYVDKRETYARFGVREYWRFDRTGGEYHDTALAGDQLVNGQYEPLPLTTGEDGIIRGYSAALGLELHWSDGWLRFWDPASGEYLPELTEAKAQRDAAIAQRDAAAAQRDAAAAQRDAAQERVRQLEAELRRMRGE